MEGKWDHVKWDEDMSSTSSTTVAVGVQALTLHNTAHQTLHGGGQHSAAPELCWGQFWCAIRGGQQEKADVLTWFEPE